MKSKKPSPHPHPQPADPQSRLPKLTQDKSQPFLQPNQARQPPDEQKHSPDRETGRQRRRASDSLEVRQISVGSFRENEAFSRICGPEDCANCSAQGQQSRNKSRHEESSSDVTPSTMDFSDALFRTALIEQIKIEFAFGDIHTDDRISRIRQVAIYGRLYGRNKGCHRSSQPGKRRDRFNSAPATARV